MFESCGRPSALRVVRTPSRCWAACSRAVARSMPGSYASAQDEGGAVDGEAGEAADDGAVDADELEVPTEERLELVGGLGRVPAGDGGRDERGDLVAVVGGDVA